MLDRTNRAVRGFGAYFFVCLQGFEGKTRTEFFTCFLKRAPLFGDFTEYLINVPILGFVYPGRRIKVFLDFRRDRFRVAYFIEDSEHPILDLRVLLIKFGDMLLF